MLRVPLNDLAGPTLRRTLHELAESYQVEHLIGMSQRYAARMSIVDREPRSSKWRSIHARARSFPEEHAISVEFACGPETAHNIVGGQTEWMSRRFASLNFPSSMSFVMKATARIFRMSEELKLISSTRFMISRALVGLSGRSIGLTCTMRMSRSALGHRGARELMLAG
jgi:hypothetical protein